MTDISTVLIRVPEGANIILGQSHFIKTVEDLYEALTSSSPFAKFGIAFCESSGPALVRHDGNDKTLEEKAVEYALALSAGHVFVLLLKDVYPINVIEKVRRVEEVATIFCATANPIEVVIAETKMGRAVLGVVDGMKTKGVEGEKERSDRHTFLRKIGYKR